MNKIITSLCFFLLVVTTTFGQVGNEWINFNQPYYKIPVGQDGIYKLTFNDLQAAGFPVIGINPTRIQLFHRGIEQSIYVEGENDTQFNPGDFIEFFGQRNDGTLDAALYKPSSAQPHSYYNLFSDTTFYFLTIGGSTGKRMNFSNLDNTSLPVASHHLDEKLKVLTEHYAYGSGYNSQIYTSTFDSGEGWTGAQIVKNGFRDYTLENITNTVTSAGSPQIEILLMGTGPMDHKADIYVGSSLRSLATITFSGYDTYKHVQQIDWSDISSDGKLTVRVSVSGVEEVDRLSVSYIKLQYPQQTNAENSSEKIFSLAPNSANTYLQINNATAGLRLFDITNTDNVERVGVTASTTLNAVARASTQLSRIFASSITYTPSVKPVRFRQIQPKDNIYLIISHPLLQKSALGYSDPVKAYAGYRASAEGGSFDTLVVNIQQVYDQFNYGEQSPLAIFHFMKFMAAKPPSYLFLIGKGLDVTYNYYRSTNTAAWPFKDLVPTGGSPGSDMLFTAGLSGDSQSPLVPTGRLTAMKPEQVASYLNKIVEVEKMPFDDLWQKNILHLSGGVEDGEPELFRAYLHAFEPIVEEYYLGGKVSAIAKESRDIKIINVAEEVNKGLNLITFFGHASPSTLDFDIGYASNPVMGYNNAGKYPLLLMNGCSAGAFFLNDFLFGEDWVMADKKGAKGFIAHSSLGLASSLRQYSEIFYNVGYGDSSFIYKGVGDILKETAKRYIQNSFLSTVHLSQIQQMILLGDPAVKLFGASKPDLEINDDNLAIESFDEKQLTAQADSLALKFIVRNFGQARPGTFRVEVVRTLNDNSTVTYDSLYTAVRYSDTLTFVIKGLREKGFGNNIFKVTLDPDNVVDELNKENNVATISRFIPLNGTKNLYPSAFAIVNTSTTNLSVQNTDLLAAERTFLIEVDTVDTFDSPFKRQYTTTGTVLARQAIELLDKDTLAYYWRSKFATPQQGENEAWEVSSFTYIKDSPEGWAQVHFPQYSENTTDGLVPNALLRKLSFQESATAIDIRTFGVNAGKPRDSVSVKIAGAEYNLYTIGNGAYGCRNNTINLIAFDRKSTAPYAALDFKWYEILYTYGGRRLICGREPFAINSFTSTEVNTGQQDDLIQYVDKVALGDSVVLYNIGDAGFNTWPSVVKEKLGEFGIAAAQIAALKPGEPVVIFGRKGLTPGAAIVYTLADVEPDKGKLVVNKTITGRYNAGSMTTMLVGPAVNWKSVTTQVSEVTEVDNVQVDLVGITTNGQEEILLSKITDNHDLSFIDASVYPLLKLVFTSSDDIDLTSAQLKKWLIHYTPVPEGILLHEALVQPTTFIEGAVYTDEYKFVNVSDKIFADSLTVNLKLFNQARRTSRVQHFRILQPAPGDTTKFSINFTTQDLEGLNDVEVFVNPKVVQEQYYDNNILQFRDHVNVIIDDIDPVLDVTVDGRYITNGDFVSPSPVVNIKLWDENPYPKNDTTGMQIFLARPCAEPPCLPAPIYFSSKEVKWYGASETSAFTVLFTPVNLEDGNYILQVAAADNQGNKSGIEPYEVSFVVANETNLSLNEPYPNPSDNEINFEFILTGNTLPRNASLQIIDFTGKLVYNSPIKDVAMFHIGKNSLSWSAIENHLSPGIYHYKLTFNLNDQVFDKQGKIVFTP